MGGTFAHADVNLRHTYRKYKDFFQVRMHWVLPRACLLRMGSLYQAKVTGSYWKLLERRSLSEESSLLLVKRIANISARHASKARECDFLSSNMDVSGLLQS